MLNWLKQVKKNQYFRYNSILKINQYLIYKIWFHFSNNIFFFMSGFNSLLAGPQIAFFLLLLLGLAIAYLLRTLKEKE